MDEGDRQCGWSGSAVWFDAGRPGCDVRRLLGVGEDSMQGLVALLLTWVHTRCIP